jgi:prolyl 4-hydroxylase
VFAIDNFISDFEADSIIATAKGRVRRSGVGDSETGRESDTRTSNNAWLSRTLTPITDTVSKRVANVLRLKESLLVNAEEMQVVHYAINQRYEPHHDWGVENQGPESRFITILMYLTDQEDPEAGGETSFPKSDTGNGFKVRPVKGTAVLFYNLLEDGNADDLTLHAALPVIRGEKWLANYWIWDPKRIYQPR